MHLGLEIGFLFARGQQQGEVLGMPVGQGGVRGRLLRVTVADRLGVVDAPIVPDEGLNQEPSDASRYNQTPADTIRRQQIQSDASRYNQTPAGTTNQVHSRTR